MKVAGESDFSFCLKRLAGMKKALSSLAVNPGELDTDHPTSVPWLLLGQINSCYHFTVGIQYTVITSLVLSEEDSNFLLFIQAYTFIAKGI